MSTPTVDRTDPAPDPTDRFGDPGLRAAFGAELIKFRTARAPRRNLLLGTLLGIALSLLLAVATGATLSEWSEADRADFDPLLFPLSGSLFVAIFYSAVGVGTVMAEYSSGMARTTFTATPRRGRVLVAKSLVVALVTAVAGFFTVLVMLFGAQAIFAAYDAPTIGAGDPDLWRTVAAITVTAPIFPVIAVAVTFMLRSTAAALSTVLALIFLPSMFGGLLPRWWQENIISLLPGPASDSFALAHLDDSPMYLHPALGAVVTAAWVLGLLAVAKLFLERRDA